MSEKVCSLFKDLLGRKIKYDNCIFFVAGIHPSLGITMKNINYPNDDMLCLVRGGDIHEKHNWYNQKFIDYVKFIEQGFAPNWYWGEHVVENFKDYCAFS